jgi:transformation/transcription domain-associated protein
LIERFRSWRDQLEAVLDNRPKNRQLEYLSHYLSEFEYSKFDEVEVPGQYALVSLILVDNRFE